MLRFAAKEVLFGLTPAVMAERAFVDLSTARRWKRGDTEPSQAQLALISGDLGMLSKEWAGWIVRKGILISPEGLEAQPGDVRAIPYEKAARSALERRIRELEAGMPEEIEDQPLPDDAPGFIPLPLAVVA